MSRISSFSIGRFSGATLGRRADWASNMRSSLLLAIALLWASVVPAAALRCGSALVVEGQSKFEVLQRCGAPAYTDEYTEYRAGGTNPTIPRPLDSLGQTYPAPVAREVRIEQWVYNFGPTRLMPTLTFENGRLIKIETLGYGR